MLYSALLLLVLAISGAADCASVESSATSDRRPDRRGEERKAAGLLRVAHFNAEWLFPDGVSTKSPWSAADEHTAGVARLLDSLDADIIHLSVPYIPALHFCSY